MDKGNTILYGDRVVVSGYEFLKNWLIQICENYFKLLWFSKHFMHGNIYNFFYVLVRFDLVMPDDYKMCQKLLTLK